MEENFSKYMKECNSRARERNTNGTTTFLIKNKVTFVETGIENIVLVEINESYSLYVSLKKKDNHIRYRRKGEREWYLATKPNFIAHLEKYEKAVPYVPKRRTT